MSTNIKNLVKAQLVSLVQELIEERDGARAELEKVYNVNASLLREIEELKNQIVTQGCIERIEELDEAKSEEVEIKSFGNLLKYHKLNEELRYFGALFVAKKITVVNDHPKYFAVKGNKKYEQDFKLLKKALEDKGEKCYLQSDLNGVRLNIVK